MRDFVNIDSGSFVYAGATMAVRVDNMFMHNAKIVRVYLTPDSAKTLRAVSMSVARWECALGPMVSPIDPATGRYLDSGSPSFDVPASVPRWFVGVPLILTVENLTGYQVRCIGTVEVDWDDRPPVQHVPVSPLAILGHATPPPDTARCRCGELLTHAKHHWGACPTPMPAKRGYR